MMDECSIRELSNEVKSKLRSGLSIASVAQCVEELVLNAIDCEASCVAVRIDLNIFRIQVVDNGNGISQKDLKLVGTRYATSKCHSLEDINGNLSHYGFRGEALANIIQMAGITEILSRHKNSVKTFSKLFTYGKEKPLVVSDVNRPSSGTTVTIQDFMYNMPVRRKSIKESIDLENIRIQIESIALMHPTISFSIRNDRNNDTLLQVIKTHSRLNRFIHLFGKEHLPSMAETSYSFDKFTISGFISTQPYNSKYLQFVYINKRFIFQTKIQSFINNLISRTSIIRNKIPLNMGSSNAAKISNSPPKGIRYYGVYVLNIECPHSVYDICLTPKKTLVEFKDWQKIFIGLEEMFIKFSKEEDLAISLDDRFRKSERETFESYAESPMPHSCKAVLHIFNNSKRNNKDIIDNANNIVNKKSEISVANMKAAVHGCTAVREKANPIIKDMLDHENLKKVVEKHQSSKAECSNINKVAFAASPHYKGSNDSASYASSLNALKILNTKVKEFKINSLSQTNDEVHRIKVGLQDKKRFDCKIHNGEYTSSISDFKRICLEKKESKSLSVSTHSKMNNDISKQLSSIQELKNIHQKKLKEIKITPLNKVRPIINSPNLDLIKSSRYDDTQDSLDLYYVKPSVGAQKKTFKNSLTCSISNKLGKKTKIKKTLNSYRYEIKSQKPDKYLQTNKSTRQINIPESSVTCDNTFVFDPVGKCSQELYAINVTESGKKNSGDVNTGSSDFCKNYTSNIILTNELRLQEIELLGNEDAVNKYVINNTSAPNFVGYNLENEDQIKRSCVAIDYADFALTSSHTQYLDTDGESKKFKNTFNTNLNYPFKENTNSDGYREVGKIVNKYNAVDNLVMDACASDNQAQIFNKNSSLTRFSRFHQSAETDSYKPADNLNLLSNDMLESFEQSNNNCSASCNIKIPSQEATSLHIHPEDCDYSCNLEDQRRYSHLNDNSSFHHNTSLDIELNKSSAYFIDDKKQTVENLTEINTGKSHTSVDIFTSPNILTSEKSEFKNNNSDFYNRKEDEHAISNISENNSECLYILNEYLGNQNDDSSNNSTSLQSTKHYSESNKFLSIASTMNRSTQCNLPSNATSHGGNSTRSVGCHILNMPVTSENDNFDNEAATSEEMTEDLGPSHELTSFLPTKRKNEYIKKGSPKYQKVDASLHIDLDVKNSLQNEIQLSLTCNKLSEGMKLLKKTKSLSSDGSKVIFPLHETEVSKHAQKNNFQTHSCNGGSENKNINNLENLSHLNNIMDKHPCDSDNLQTFPKKASDALESKCSSIGTQKLSPIPVNLNHSSHVQGNTEIISYTPVLHKNLHSTLRSKVPLPITVDPDESSYIPANTTEPSHISVNTDEASPVSVNISVKIGQPNLTPVKPLCTYTQLNSEQTNKELVNLEEHSVIPINLVNRESNFENFQDAFNVADGPSNLIPEKSMSNFVENFEQSSKNSNDLHNIFYVEEAMNMFIDNHLDLHNDDVSENEQVIAQDCIGEKPPCIDFPWNEWSVPNFAMDSVVLSSSCGDSDKVSAIKSYNVVHPYKFSGDMLQNAKVLGQVDNKFIVIALTYKSTVAKKCTPSVPFNLIILVDQHAADERVQLEKVTAGIYIGNTKQLKRTDLTTPIEVNFRPEETRIMKAYSQAFLDIGLEITLVNNETVRFHTLPCCLVAQDKNERYTRRCQTAAKVIESTVKEMCEDIRIMGGTSNFVKMRPLPKPLQYIINTIACKSAIKFGDVLSLEQCQNLLKLLGKCKLPFQCAHGRPSLVPVVDLNYLPTKHKEFHAKSCLKLKLSSKK